MNNNRWYDYIHSILRLNMYNFNLQRIQERNDIKKNMLVIRILQTLFYAMNGTLLLPLSKQLQSIRWLCTYVQLPSGLHVNKQTSCGSKYTLKETFSSISSLEAHKTSSLVTIRNSLFCYIIFISSIKKIHNEENSFTSPFPG